MFHSSCKDRFRQELQSEAQNAWDTIIANRHEIAHDEDESSSSAISNLTFGELRALYPKALSVLECLNNAIAASEVAQAEDAYVAASVSGRLRGWRITSAARHWLRRQSKP
jgi:hypothetical protein